MAVLRNGSAVIIGGERARTKVTDGRDTITMYGPGNATTKLATMNYLRWYPTPCRVDDSRFLIVGGTQGISNNDPVPHAEVWDSEAPTQPLQVVQQPAAFQAAAGLNWYPFVMLLANGDVLWWGNRSGSITKTGPATPPLNATTPANWTLVRDVPSLPASHIYDSMYPGTATIAPLALRWQNNYRSSFIIFGGGVKGSHWRDPKPACPYSLRLDINHNCTTDPSRYCFSTWTNESMLGVRRVLGDSTLLPNGKIVLNGGGEAGGAFLPVGANKTNFINRPLLINMMYDPYATVGKRYSLLGPTNILRLYHTTACLILSGEVLVAGSESSGGRFIDPLPAEVSLPPTLNEFRLEVITPTEIRAGVARPTIITAPATITRGRTFNMTFTAHTVNGASLAAPCAQTHSINSNQRVVFLKMTTLGANRTWATFEAPPAHLPHVAPAGYYMLFLLGTSRTYSKGVWVQLLPE